MKKPLHSLLIAVCVLCAVSCGSRHSISAHIDAPDGTVVVHAQDLNDNMQTDTIRLKDGRFVYDIPESMSDPVFISMISAPDIYPTPDGGHFRPTGKSINLIMSRGDRLGIKAERTDGGIIYDIKGSEFNAGLSAHHREFLPLQAKIDSLNIEIEKAFAISESVEEDPLLDSLFGQRGGYAAEINAARKRYVRENPDRELSAFYAVRYPERDSLEYYMSLVDPAAMEGFLKPYIEMRRQYLAEYLEYKKNKETIAEGADAPPFTLSDRDGKAVSLTDIESDYVVLDFWGSWCGYCIAGFPKMKEYYAKYGGKVEFVGIDCRDSHAEWIAALDKYELPWMQLIDNPDDKTAVKYAVAGYPTKILIGPDRKIVSIYLGEVEDFYRKLDELFK